MSKINDLIKELCPNGVEYDSLENITLLQAGDRITTAMMSDDYNYDVIGGGTSPTGKYNDYNREHCITISRAGSAGFVNWIEDKFWATDVCFTASQNNDYMNIKFIYHYLKNSQREFKQHLYGGSMPKLEKPFLWKYPIPIPPLEVQNEIVRILDKFGELEAELEAELEVRKNQYEFWRGNIFGSIEGRKVKLGDLLDYIQPTKYIVSSTEYSDEYKTPVLTAGQTFILGYTNENDGIYKASNNKPVIIFDDFTTSNHWVDFDFKVKSSAMKMLVPKTNDNFRYIYHAIKNIKYEAKEHSRQWIQNFSNFDIVLPNIEKQNKIVDILDKFDTLVSDMSIGLPAEIELRRKQYEYYRNKLLSFEELSVSE